MSLPNKSIQPSFLLKYIQPQELYQKYKKGYFNRPIPVKAKIVLDAVSKMISRQNGATLIEFVKSNQSQMDQFLKTNKVMGGRCDYCKQDFQTEAIGYPIAYECQHVITPHGIYDINHLFWTEGCHCDYACCLAYVKNFNIHQDFLLHDVEILLRFMYKLDTNTDDILLPAKDFRLLHNPLTLDEWRHKNTQYVRTNHVTKIPIQVTYMKQHV